jgi:DNA-binding NtrC family response regulator
MPAAHEQPVRRLIDQALRDYGRNKQKAAQTLGLSRQGFFKKLKMLKVANL